MKPRRGPGPQIRQPFYITKEPMLRIRHFFYLSALLIAFAGCDTNSNTPAETPDVDPPDEKPENIVGKDELRVTEHFAWGNSTSRMEIASTGLVRHFLFDPYPTVSAQIDSVRQNRFLDLFRNLRHAPLEPVPTPCADASYYDVDLISPSQTVLRRTFYQCGIRADDSVMSSLSVGIDSVYYLARWLHRNHDPWRGLKLNVELVLCQADIIG